MAAFQVKQFCMYLELANLPNIINPKLDEWEDILTQTLVFPKPKSKPFKKYDGNCSHSTFFMPKAKTITQIRSDDQNKGKRKAQIQK